MAALAVTANEDVFGVKLIALAVIAYDAEVLFNAYEEVAGTKLIAVANDAVAAFVAKDAVTA